MARGRACEPSRLRDAGSIPGLGRSPGEGNGKPFQYSYLEKPMDRGAWQASLWGCKRVKHDLATKQQHWKFISQWSSLYLKILCISGIKSGSGGNVYVCNLDRLVFILKSRARQPQLKGDTACMGICCFLDLVTGHNPFSSQMSDRGGGVPLRKIDRLFNYMYSTAPRPRVETSRAVPLVRDQKSWSGFLWLGKTGYHINQLSHCVGVTDRMKGSY